MENDFNVCILNTSFSGGDIHEKGVELAVGHGRKRKEGNKERKIEKNERDISKVSKRKKRWKENKDPIDSAFGIWQSPCGRW